MFSLDNIKQKARDDINRQIENEDDLWAFLARWWCKKYNKPMKASLSEVQQYSLEELFYEFYICYYMDRPDKLKEDSEEADADAPRELSAEEIAKDDEDFADEISKKFGVRPLNDQEQFEVLKQDEQKVELGDDSNAPPLPGDMDVKW